LELSTETGINTIGRVLIVIVEDVASPAAEGRHAGCRVSQSWYLIAVKMNKGEGVCQ